MPPSLPHISGAEARRVLEKLGFTVVRQKCSHFVLRRGSHGCVVPLHRPRTGSTSNGRPRNNRLPCFLDDNDRLGYLQILRESLLATGCQLHAYVLMDNHVHLLMTPPEAGGVSDPVFVVK